MSSSAGETKQEEILIDSPGLDKLRKQGPVCAGQRLRFPTKQRKERIIQHDQVYYQTSDSTDSGVDRCFIAGILYSRPGSW